MNAVFSLMFFFNLQISLTVILVFFFWTFIEDAENVWLNKLIPLTSETTVKLLKVVIC